MFLSYNNQEYEKNQKNGVQCYCKMVLVRLEPIACMLLEKRKLIKKLICSFSCLSVFTLKFFTCSEAQCLSAALAEATTPTPLCHSDIIAFCLEILGQEVRRTSFGLSTVSYEMGSLGLQIMLSQSVLSIWSWVTRARLCSLMNLFLDVFLSCRATFAVHYWLQGRLGKQVLGFPLGSLDS